MPPKLSVSKKSYAVNYWYFCCCLGTQNELLLERQRLSQLQADFDYNLSLLSQRDEELAHYEKAFAELKRVINNLLTENSELKVSGVCVCVCV